MAIQRSPIVDSHVHVWSNDPSVFWATEMTDPPKHSAGPDELLQLMKAHDVDAAVLVQYIGYRWNNDYVASVLTAFPDMFAGVCRVDPEDPKAPDLLQYWTEERGFRGVRISPEPDARGGWFRGSLMRPLFRRAAELRIPMVVLTKPSRLPDLLAILDHCHDVDVVVDHLADCDIVNPEHRQSLEALARNPRVYMKTGHMWANSAKPYPWEDQHGILKYLCEWFGPERIMWGSDWSFCLRHASYGQALSYLRDEAGFLSPSELAWILGGTAQRLWQFPALRDVLDDPSRGAVESAGITEPPEPLFPGFPAVKE